MISQGDIQRAVPQQNWQNQINPALGKVGCKKCIYIQKGNNISLLCMSLSFWKLKQSTNKKI